MAIKSFARLILALVFITVGFGADPAPTTGETSLNLDIAFGIRFVPDSRVTVPVGETVRMNAPLSGDYIQWFKDKVVIPGAKEKQFVLHNAQPSDTGIYTAQINDPAALALPLQNINLTVGAPTGRLINSSTRAMVGAGQQTLVGGFVVTGPGFKKVIVRAVGPALALFGIQNALAQPVLRIFDGQGRAYTEGYVYLPMVGAPTYESDLRDSLEKSGAFPLPPGSRDAVDMRPFKAGSYTVHVTGADGGGGVVLLEVYEVP